MYEVVLYFDNMVDETYRFDTYKEALEKVNNLKWQYRTKRLYSFKVRKVERWLTLIIKEKLLSMI